MTPVGLSFYAGICGWTLARAHARSGDPVAIAAYLGEERRVRPVDHRLLRALRRPERAGLPGVRRGDPIRPARSASKASDPWSPAFSSAVVGGRGARAGHGQGHLPQALPVHAGIWDRAPPRMVADTRTRRAAGCRVQRTGVSRGSRRVLTQSVGPAHTATRPGRIGAQAEGLVAAGIAGLLSSGGGRRVVRCVVRCAARPCGIPSWLASSPRDGGGHGVVPAADLSMACSSLASSADSSPIATRSRGLMNPSLSRKPPARTIASRSGTAQ